MDRTCLVLSTSHSMPRTQHSPKPRPTDDSQTQSDSDAMITPKNAWGSKDLDHETVQQNLSTKRQKRPRAESSSPKNELADFKLEIKHLLTSWKSDQDAILSKLVSDISELKALNSTIQKSNLEIEKSMEFMNIKYEEISNHIMSLEKERSESRKCILDLEKKFQELYSCSRSSSIEIRNVPMAETESFQELSSVVSKIGTLVGNEINPVDIRDLYRLPGKPGAIKPIVAEFSTVQTKLDLISSVRNFNKDRIVADKLNTTQIGLSGSKNAIFID